MVARTDLTDYLTPADFALVERARKRSAAAADRLINVIAQRCSWSERRHALVRALMMADQTDHSWPPKFLQERK